MRYDFQLNVSPTKSVVVNFDLEFDGNKPIITGIVIHSNYRSELPSHPSIVYYKGENRFAYEYTDEKGKRIIGYTGDDLSKSLIKRIYEIVNDNVPKWND